MQRPPRRGTPRPYVPSLPPKKAGQFPRSTTRSAGFKFGCVVFCLFLVYWGSVLQVPKIIGLAP